MTRASLSKAPRSDNERIPAHSLTVADWIENAVGPVAKIVLCFTEPPVESSTEKTKPREVDVPKSQKRVNRREFLGTTANAAVGATLMGSGAFGVPPPPRPRAQSGSARRPNILMIVTDSEQWRSGFPEDLPLPNRDRLRDRGVTFARYHVNTIACGPSRSVMHTGQHIQKTRVYDNPIMTRYPGRVPLNPELTPTLSLMLPQQGYFVKEAETGPGSGRGLTQSGFFGDPVAADKSAAWLREQAPAIGREQPWLFFVEFSNPHDMMFFDATGRNEETRVKKGFIGEMMPAPNVAPYTDELGYGLPESFDDGIDTKPTAHYAFMRDTNYVHGPIPHEDRAAWERARNYYFNCMRDVDRHIGTVLDALEDSGQIDNTVVLFTSDHGELATSHGMWQKGPCLYKENLGVPLIFSHPDVAGGVRTQSLSCALDLAPTILGFTGMTGQEMEEQYPDLRGYNLGPVIERPNQPGPRDRNAGGILVSISSVYECNPDLKYKMLTTEIPPGRQGSDFFRFPEDVIQWEIRSFVRGIYDGRYRFARYFSPGQHHTPTDWRTLTRVNDLELYDTEADPHEMDNLAFVPEKHQELILELNSRLNRLIETEVGDDDGSYMPGSPDLWKL